LVFPAFYAFHPWSAWLWSAAQIDGLRELGPGRVKVKRHPFWAPKERAALMNFRLFRLASLGALLLVLGCTQKISICPVPAILADTQSVTIFRPGTTPDLANELFTVSLINATGDCTYNTHSNLVHATLDLTFRATRAPTSEAATYSLPYFVVVHENAKIFVKRLYTLKFTFAPGAAVTTITQSPDELELAISNGKLPWNYQEMTGFQMTAAQIEYNKTRGRYVP
jgi:hypothetical protein